jgi:hypothetical protein
VFCSYGFTATGGVRLRRADVSKSVNFTEARLGGEGPVALNLYGLTTQELVLRFAVPPIGDVWLTRAEVASVYDSGQLWRTDGVLDLEDFRYAAITADVEVDVRTRLRWLEGTVREYDPDPYDQLADSYRDAGHDDRADAVQLAKQRRRHASQGPVGRLWGWLQEWTVGYGYRPWLAALWLAAFWLAGVLWFGGHRLNKLDSDQDPAWNPWLYAADLLIPVVNLGPGRTVAHRGHLGVRGEPAHHGRLDAGHHRRGRRGPDPQPELAGGGRWWAARGHRAVRDWVTDRLSAGQ